jgi:uncharacterized membrane protein
MSNPTPVGMSNPIVYIAVVAAAFLLAGLVKGVTGLALPDWHFLGLHLAIGSLW